MDLPEHDAAASSAAGDLEARHLLLERHIGSLRNYIRVRLGHHLRKKETSLDLTQSVCRQVLKNFDAFEYRGDDRFRHWLQGQAENKIRDRQRYWHRSKRDRDREESTSSSAQAGHADRTAPLSTQDLRTPSRLLSGREELERLEAVFAALPETFRLVIHYARVQGLSHQEIAERMGRTVSATRTLLCRALARLANDLEGGAEEK